MSEWVIPCNPRAYDIVGSFNKFDTINWKQSANIEIGDMVYIYVGKPYSAILYKGIVTDIDLPEALIDDSEFSTESTNYGDYGRYMELKKIIKFDKDLLTYQKLKENGLNSVQGPSRVKPDLEKYINWVLEETNFAIGELTGDEREAIIKRRIGQSAFKQSVLSKYHVCVLCGIDFEPLLIASHIKPWSESNSQEKVDVNNGLLLCPHHDQLFDKGYISFDENGKILISEQLHEHIKVLMNINVHQEIRIDDSMRHYVSWHRENIYKT